jgi:hypothetical protein
MDRLVTIAIGVVFIGVVAASIDVYLRLRTRWLRKEFSATRAPTPVAGIDATGELTTGAKYAIWNYMFSILGIGGTIIGIVSGIAGYMINDLATEKPIQVALNKMQAPLADRLAQFADAKSALDTATKNVMTEQFESTVAAKLSGDDEFRRRSFKPSGMETAFGRL